MHSVKHNMINRYSNDSSSQQSNKVKRISENCEYSALREVDLAKCDAWKESWHRTAACVLRQILSSKFLVHFSLFLTSQPMDFCVCVTFDCYIFKNQVNKYSVWKIELKKENWDFPCGPVVKTPHLQCRGHGFNPCWGTEIPHATWWIPPK